MEQTSAGQGHVLPKSVVYLLTIYIKKKGHVALTWTCTLSLCKHMRAARGIVKFEWLGGRGSESVRSARVPEYLGQFFFKVNAKRKLAEYRRVN